VCSCLQLRDKLYLEHVIWCALWVWLDTCPCVIVTRWTYVLSLVCFTSVLKVSGLELRVHLRKLRRNFFEMGNLTRCRQFDSSCENGDLLGCPGKGQNTSLLSLSWLLSCGVVLSTESVNSTLIFLVVTRPCCGHWFTRLHWRRSITGSHRFTDGFVCTSSAAEWLSETGWL